MEKKCESARSFGSRLPDVCLIVVLSRRDNEALRPESILIHFDVNSLHPSPFRYGWFRYVASLGYDVGERSGPHAARTPANEIRHSSHTVSRDIGGLKNRGRIDRRQWRLLGVATLNPWGQTRW